MDARLVSVFTDRFILPELYKVFFIQKERLEVIGIGHQFSLWLF